MLAFEPLNNNYHKMTNNHIFKMKDDCYKCSPSGLNIENVGHNTHVCYTPTTYSIAKIEDANSFAPNIMQNRKGRSLANIQF